jgi:hypothetical protein
MSSARSSWRFQQKADVFKLAFPAAAEKDSAVFSCFAAPARCPVESSSETLFSEAPASIKMPLSEVPLSLVPRSEASASSELPLSETPAPQGTSFSAATDHE